MAGGQGPQGGDIVAGGLDPVGEGLVGGRLHYTLGSSSSGGGNGGGYRTGEKGGSGTHLTGE